MDADPTIDAETLHQYLRGRFPQHERHMLRAVDVADLARHYPTVGAVDDLLNRTLAARTQMQGYSDDHSRTEQILFMATLLDGTRELSRRAPPHFADRVRELRLIVPRQTEMV